MRLDAIGSEISRRNFKKIRLLRQLHENLNRYRRKAVDLTCGVQSRDEGQPCRTERFEQQKTRLVIDARQP